MHRPVAITVLALLLASPILVSVPTASAADGPALYQPEGFDRTTFPIQPYENGNARWTIEHRRTLENQSELEQFRSFADEFESDRTGLYESFVDRSTALVALGTNATGRTMIATDHDRSTSVSEMGQRQGVVSLSFRWTNFSVESEDRVVVGDVFEGGLFVGEDQRLVVRRGPNLSFAGVQPEGYTASNGTLAESDTITWLGERRFADNRPHVELVPPGSTGELGSGVDSNPLVFLVLLLIVAVVATGIAYRRGLFDRIRADDADDAGSTTDVGPDSGGQGPPPESEFVSDRDRVKTLLSDNQGRMKQVRIVEETDWSKSKVSMLLSEMEEEGEISKLRVGRENIVSLAGHEPDAAGSPFDDE